MLVILGKLGVGIGCLAVTWAAIRSDVVERLPFRSFAIFAVMTTVLVRLTCFSVLFLILGYDVPSDVPAAYYPEAKEALAGGLVYRDFFSTYSPLFPYVGAVAVGLWRSTRSFVLLAIFFEACGLAVWLRVCASEFPERVVRVAAILYAFSPLLISSVAMGGQNHVWISLFLATAVLLTQRNSDAWAGAVLGLGLLATKFLVMIFLPVLLLMARRRVRFLGGFAGIVGAAYGTLYSMGADVLIPLVFQRSAGQESSGNLPYLLSLAGVPVSSPVYVLAALGICGPLCGLAWFFRERLSRQVLIGAGTVLLFAVVLILSKKSYTTYWASCFFPLCAYWAGRFRLSPGGLAGFLSWGVVATLEPSLYFRWMDGQLLGKVAGLDFAPAVVFVAAQVAVVAFNIVAANLGLRSLIAAGRASGPSRIA